MQGNEKDRHSAGATGRGSRMCTARVEGGNKHLRNLKQNNDCTTGGTASKRGGTARWRLECANFLAGVLDFISRAEFLRIDHICFLQAPSDYRIERIECLVTGQLRELPH